MTPDRRDRARLAVVFLLLIVSLLAWRKGTYYSGGLDSVVVAKALLGGIAFVIALVIMSRRQVVHVIGVSTVTLVTSYLAVTVLGAWSEGSPVAAFILAARVYLVMLTMACLVVAFPAATLVWSLLDTLTGITVVLTLSGLGSIGGAGRLTGGLLPVSPNQMALLMGPSIVGYLWAILQGRPRRIDPWLLAFLCMATLLTGSRTGLLGLLAAVFILVVLAPRVHIGTLIGVLVAIPGIFYLVAFTPLVSGYFGREGQGRITTLNSRTIAWQSAFAGGKPWWQEWFGGGLDIKTVSVTGTYWDSQVLDSSWVSAFVQAGKIGVGLLIVWSLITLWRSATSPRPYRALYLALTVYVLIRSLLENGLLDAYVLNVLMLFPALLVEARPPRATPERPPAARLGAAAGR